MTQATTEPGRRAIQPSEFIESEIKQFQQILELYPNGDERNPPALLSPEGEKQVIPAPIYRALCDIVESLRQGQAVSIVPTKIRLTTQQAADFLHISRPTLVKLLTSGEIPYTTVGRHRRVQLTDLLAYEKAQEEARNEFLHKQTQEAGAAGTYFDTLGR